MGEGTLTQVEPAQRFIIERPRLIQLLDETSARIILLVAPAGYGKTTLARQWLERGRRGIWIRATPAANDVAALASEVARALAPLLPEVPKLVETRLATAQRPDDEAAALGASIAQAVTDWPDDLWLVLDDYHCITAVPSDAFVEALTSGSPLRLLVTSRQKPPWASARRILYDEIGAVGVDELSLTAKEGLALLSEHGAAHASAILERARGWPAVVRLAALSKERILPRVAEGTALYDYFAEELFQAAPEDVQRGLLAVTPYPTLTSEIVAAALGQTAATTCDSAISLGLLSRYDESLVELHPLLREFLELKLGRDANREQIVESAFSTLLELGRWDDAHTLIDRFDEQDLYDPLLESALPALLAEHRIATLQEWASRALAQARVCPVAEVAAAEVDLRLGALEDSVTRATHAARNLEGSVYLSRAYAVAAEAAHFLMQPDRSLESARLAEQHATTPADARRAVWAHLTASTDFEVEDPLDLVARFETVADQSVDSALRVLIARSMASVISGNVNAAFEESREQLALADQSGDVFARTSFLYRIAYTGMLAGRYAESLPAARLAAGEIAAARLGFASMLVLGVLAATMIGLRRLRRASRFLDQLSEELRLRPNKFAEANWHAVKGRLLITAGALDAAAVEINAAAEIRMTKSMQGELFALHALCLAGGASPTDADAQADRAEATTREVQALTLASLARAVRSLRVGDGNEDAHLATSASLLLQRENYDSLVYSIRAYPPLLSAFRERTLLPESTLMRVVRNARDTDLADSLGWEIDPERHRTPLLTQREAEVFDLLRRGLTNREIAQELFISEATVKVHVRHILEKFGARSRTEAVIKFGRS